MTYTRSLQIIVFSLCILIFTAKTLANELHSVNNSAVYPTLSQTNIALSPNEITLVTYEDTDGLAVFEGDIILGESKNIQNTNGQYSPEGAIISKQYLLWGGNTIPYQISSSISNQTTIDRIKTAITHWQEKTQIKFIARSNANAENYTDYIEFIPSSGCSSYVGKQGGKQNIWVGSYCTSGNIIHEIGHAIGLFHEHIRADRDNYVTINWDNIKDGKSHNFSNQSSSSNSGSYDYGSIMHYGANSFSKNGKATITTKNAENIGQRVALSLGDIATVNALYGHSLAGSIKHISSLVEPNSSFDIQLSLINQGVNAFTAATIDIQLPSTVYFDNYASQSNWSCIENIVSSIRCTLPGNVLPGTGESLTLNLIAPDYGNPLTFTAKYSTSTAEITHSLNITVNSENFPPDITRDQEITASIADLYNGGVIGSIVASDPNLDDIEFYEIVSGNEAGAFSLNNQTGEIMIADKAMVSTSSTNYSLSIRAADYELMSEPTDISIQLLDADASAYPTSSSSGGDDSSSGSSSFYLLLILLLLSYQSISRGTASSNRAV